MPERALRLVHSDSRTRVLLHVVDAERPTVRSAAKAADCAFDTARRHLIALREDGLVSWEPKTAGTLRATCRRVPFGDGGTAA